MFLPQDNRVEVLSLVAVHVASIVITLIIMTDIKEEANKFTITIKKAGKEKEMEDTIARLKAENEQLKVARSRALSYALFTALTCSLPSPALLPLRRRLLFVTTR